MLTVYDLIERHGADDVRRWLAGEDVDGLEPLAADEAEALPGFWPFWARPGQRWLPGRERVTYYSCGRGFGKSLVLSNALGEAAASPAQWSYEALLIGITPGDARSLCEQDTGIFRVAREYGYPLPAAKWTSPGELTFPPPPGETRGLHVRIASSNKPESVRGPNVGLILADEFAFFADVRDEQGYTAWEAAQFSLRVGLAKALIVSSPSRKQVVRELRDAAERPVCACGERLPPSPRVRLSPLFSADTTDPVRTCPACGVEVVADVRLIRAGSLDNAAHLTAVVEVFRRKLATGTKQVLGELGGEILDDDAGSPIPSITVHDLAGLSLTGTDPHLSLRRALGIGRVAIVVDPATTASEGAADTGLLAVGLRAQGHGPAQDRTVIGLQDWSLPAAEVEGSPSRTWAPRAALLVALWRAEEAVIETNQGGLEVVDPLRRALAILTAEDVAQALVALFPDRPQADPLAVSAGLQAARSAVVTSVTRRVDKPLRWDWASTYAAAGDLCLARAPWLPADHWTPTVAHLTGFVPSATAKRSATRSPIDRGDTLISGAQHLLGVKESATEGRLVDPSTSPIYTQGRLW